MLFKLFFNQKIKFFMKAKTFFYYFFIIFLLIISFIQLKKIKLINAEEKSERATIYIDGKDKNKSRGGVITLSSLEEPALNLSGYNLSGKVDISVYKADTKSLLNFLIHDEDNKQIHTWIDTSKMIHIASLEENIENNKYAYSEGKKIILPLNTEGIFLLKVVVNDVSFFSYVIRSNFGVVAHESENKIIFWAQDFLLKHSKTGGEVKVYNLQDKVTLLEETTINNEGIAETQKTGQADIAVVSSGGVDSLILLNMQYLNGGYWGVKFTKSNPTTKYFSFSDRPLYKPGDTVNYKAIMRSDFDVNYQIFNGKMNIVAYHGYGQDKKIIYKDEKTTNEYGSIDGSFMIPKNAKTGHYTIKIEKQGKAISHNNWNYTPSATINFQVEHYRKPEYTIDIEAEKTKIVAGDDLKFVIKGNYFSGQPLNSKKVNYTIKKAKYYDLTYLSQLDKNDNFYWYGSWYGSEIIKETEIYFDKNGLAEVVLENIQNDPKNNYNSVYVIEAEFKDATQNRVTTKKNILVYNANFGIFQKKYYRFKENEEFNPEFQLINYKNDIPVGIKEAKIEIKRSKWICQEKNKCEKQIETYPKKFIKTDKNGNFTINLKNAKKGTYDLKISVDDDRGNTIEKEFDFWVGNYHYNYNEEKKEVPIALTSDRKIYLPGEKMNVEVLSEIQDTDAFISIERDWLKKFQVVKIRNGKGSLNFEMDYKDLPNVRIKASTFTDYNFISESKDIEVSPEEYELKVDIKTDKEKYGPGDKVKLEITTNNSNNEGVSAESTIWIIDKSLYELAGDQTGDIFKKFWSKRYYTHTSSSHSLQDLMMNMSEMGGCFAADTKILMSDGKEKKIREIKKDDKILTFLSENNNQLVKARVIDTHKAKASGYLILNEKLKITENHILYVNDKWKQAGLIQIGDKVKNQNGELETINSIEWQKGEFEVYNLEIEKYHTFIANKVWVHNDKGGGVRSDFKDSAYWNPRVLTDKNGKASLTFTLPDNLTTWAISAVSTTKDTRVGQTKSEIIATKDVFIQPILPNILRTKDNIVVSAVVNNFSDIERDFNVKLEFDSGKVINATQTATINSKEFKQIDWLVIPEKENESALIKFSVVDSQNEKNGDIIELTIPVQEFGFWQTESFSGVNNQIYPIHLIENSTKKPQINFTASLSAEGPVTSAMNYLVQYPYGCMEQTTSRFVPVVIAKENEKMFKNKLKNKDLDSMINEGIDKLIKFQNDDGGWSWWGSSKNSEVPLSTYVFEYIIKSKKAGLQIDEDLYQNAIKFFKSIENNDIDESGIIPSQKNDNGKIAYRNYIFSLIGQKFDEFFDYDKLDIEELSYAIMANQNAGFEKSAKKGIQILLNKAHIDEQYISWDADDSEKYGSKSASNAMALQALLTTKSNRDIIDKVVNNLLENRKQSHWANTYGTARVIQGLVNYLRDYQFKGNNDYQVYLDDQKINEGFINSENSYLELTIPQNIIKKNESELKFLNNGNSKIYSTLIVKNFNSDIKAKSINNTISIDRSYQNEMGDDYSIGIGDVIEISLKVSNLKNNERYLLIEDFLPSGMIPINIKLENEKNTNKLGNWSSSIEYLENGIRAYIQNPPKNIINLKYKARVVNQGSFNVPPANAFYMYRPEISTMTSPKTVVIEKQSRKLKKEKINGNSKQTIQQTKPKKTVNQLIFQLFYPFALIIVVLIIYIDRQKENKKKSKIVKKDEEKK